LSNLCTNFGTDPYREDSLLSNRRPVIFGRPKSGFDSDWDEGVASFNLSGFEAGRSLPAGLASYNGIKIG
jgi:hypothetical protein